MLIFIRPYVRAQFALKLSQSFWLILTRRQHSQYSEHCLELKILCLVNFQSCHAFITDYCSTNLILDLFTLSFTHYPSPLMIILALSGAQGVAMSVTVIICLDPAGALNLHLSGSGLPGRLSPWSILGHSHVFHCSWFFLAFSYLE